MRREYPAAAAAANACGSMSLQLACRAAILHLRAGVYGQHVTLC